MSTPLAGLEADLDARRDEIEKWLEEELSKQRLPFYCSVDLRACDHKVAPVDTNLFPGGFNNLSKSARERGAAAGRKVLDRHWPDVSRVLILTERHTRNPYYASHLAVLREIVAGAGAEVRLAFLEGGAETLSAHHQKVGVEELERDGDTLRVGDFVPELVILNHDQTSGTPEAIKGVTQQFAPPPEAGWSHRRKSAHFFQYERVAARFCRSLDIDPWLVTAYFNVCSRVDVSKNIGLGCLARSVDETIEDIRSNYERNGVDDRPFVVLKADAGTYGMGVVMVESAQEAQGLNRRQRQNLSVLKEGVSSNDILIQEGVPTTDRVEGLVAEPVLYMVGSEIVGGFWRLNQSKRERENLNSRGMLFWPMEGGNSPEPLRSYTLGVVARLALLATTRELAGEIASSGAKD